MSCCEFDNTLLHDFDDMPNKKLKRSGVFVISHGFNRRFVSVSNDIDATVAKYSAELENVVEMPCITDSYGVDFSTWERNETIAQMEKYGILSVRGSVYKSKLLMMDQVLAIRTEIAAIYDRCRCCGKEGHFSAECRSCPYDSCPSDEEATQPFEDKHEIDDQTDTEY